MKKLKVPKLRHGDTFVIKIVGLEPDSLTVNAIEVECVRGAFNILPPDFPGLRTSLFNVVKLWSQNL